MEGMEIVAIVAAVAVIEYVVLTILTALARARYEVEVPATVGHPMFERYFRVQQNTLEQLITFFPGLLIFAYFVSAPWAAGIGVVFVIGRGLFAWGYVSDPPRRGPGFLVSWLSNITLILGGLIGALLQAL